MSMPVRKDHTGEFPMPTQHHHHKLDRAEGYGMIAIAIIAIILIAVVSLFTGEAEASPWKRTTATWYGPGFYERTTACGQRYTQRIRGVAIGRDRRGRYYARCGDTFVIRHRRRAVRVRVIDRCPGCVGESHRFDLSARTAMDLCRCWRPYTMRVAWRRIR